LPQGNSVPDRQDGVTLRHVTDELSGTTVPVPGGQFGAVVDDEDPVFAGTYTIEIDPELLGNGTRTPSTSTVERELLEQGPIARDTQVCVHRVRPRWSHTSGVT